MSRWASGERVDLRSSCATEEPTAAEGEPLSVFAVGVLVGPLLNVGVE